MKNKKTFQERLKILEEKIKDSYEQGVTMDEAEKMAAEFLHAQIFIAGELRNLDLDARMKKSGLKAARATAYLDIVSQADKKPTETAIGSIIDTTELVNKQQDLLDNAEVSRNEMERYYDIFNNAHIYYRGIAKGKFE